MNTIDKLKNKIGLLGGEYLDSNEFGAIYSQHNRLQLYLIDREVEDIEFDSFIVLNNFIILFHKQAAICAYTPKSNNILPRNSREYEVYGEHGRIKDLGIQENKEQYVQDMASKMLVFSAYDNIVIANKFGDTIKTLADKPHSHYYVTLGKDTFYGSWWGSNIESYRSTSLIQNKNVSDKIRTKYIDHREGQIGYTIYQQDKPSPANSVPSKNRWIMVTEDLKYFKKYDIVPWWW